MADEEEGATPGEATVAQVKMPLNLWLFVAIFELLVIGGMVAAYFILKPQEAPKELIKFEDSLPPESYVLEEDEEVFGGMYPMEPFVVNLADGGFLRLELVLQFSGLDVPNNLHLSEPLLRDGLIIYLNQQKGAELLKARGSIELKKGIESIVNKVLGSKIKRVLLAEFVVRQ